MNTAGHDSTEDPVRCKLTVLVPVYNVEQYIRPCIESIFKQGMDEMSFEVIIINDGTKDRSMEMISDIISQHSNITVFEQENQGVSVARNLGIAKAKGKYLMMVDPDDLLIENSVPFLLDKALESSPDLVVADFVQMTNQEIENRLPFIQPGINDNNRRIVEKSGSDLFIQDLNPNQCYVWRILYRRDFLLQHHITFTPGILHEDIRFCCLSYLNAQRCLKASWVPYVYRYPREGSACDTVNQRNRITDFCRAIAETWEIKQSMQLSNSEEAHLIDVVYKNFVIIINQTSWFLKDQSERYYVINYLREIAPTLYFQNGIRQRVDSFFFWHAPRFLFFASFTRRILEKVVLRFRRPSLIKHDVQKLFGNRLTN